ncbi:hypothetical protein B0H19DRAFT_1377515 [Mycena capillaripes]|nr:hypothetical protein B0H19DRAFT_1377515 [Mycena capillaripes]
MTSLICSNCGPSPFNPTKIQSEIARYKSYIAVLEAQETQLKAQLALMVFPVLTLPNETISIFHQLLYTMRLMQTGAPFLALDIIGSSAVT